MPKAPEWLSGDIQEFYPICQGNIRAIQHAIRDKRGVDIAYMTISDRLTRLGLERPRAKGKAPPIEAPTPDRSTPQPTAPVMDEAVSTGADIVPVIMSDPLSADEAQILAHYEEVIARGIKTFVEVGRALMTIRDRKLYRANYATFEAYCRERWDLSRPYAYQLIDAAVVVENLSGITDIVPVNEAQAQPLTRLPPEEQMEVWAEVVKTAAASGVTAKHVKTTISRVKGQTTGATQAKPAAPAPAPRRPPRLVVQEGLVWGLREVSDHDAWDVLSSLWGGLDALAPKYQSLRGMLDRVQRQFPKGYGPIR
jgi:hypothetical protein